MATTPNRNYPYPGPSDPPDAPGAIYQLATAIDNEAFYADATPGGGIGYAGIIGDWAGGFSERTTAVRSGRVGALNVGIACANGAQNFSFPAIDTILVVPPGLRPLHATAGIMGLYQAGGTNLWVGYAIVEFSPDGSLHLKYTSTGAGFMAGNIAYAIA